ncbi:hypothetical protein [Micromonospora psammae]|uniref:hypothetical protein n=1 Tax=Micromonospora sp. CPCC 205556 TaxID=3122398 RepID=UPI002FF03A12
MLPVEALAAAGIVVDEEGKARARRKLDEARDRWTPELDAELRAQTGIPRAPLERPPDPGHPRHVCDHRLHPNEHRRREVIARRTVTSGCR